jgi:HAMP domain-containing protein
LNQVRAKPFPGDALAVGGRTMKRIGFGVLVVLTLLFVANLFMAWRVQSQRTAKMAAIRAAGDPASIAELRPAPIPNDRNAAAQIELLAPYVKSWDHDLVQFYKSDAGKGYEERSGRGAAPTAEQAAAMRAILAKYPQMADGISRAAACPQFASRGDFSVGSAVFLQQLLDRQARFRSLVRFAAWQAAVASADGKSDEAVRKGIEILQLARLYRGEPTLMSELMSIAVEGVAAGELTVALASGPVSAEVHAAIEQELARHDGARSMVAALKTDRAYTLDAVEQLFAGSHPQLAWLLLWKAKTSFIDSLDYYDALLPVVGKPWSDVHGNIYSHVPNMNSVAAQQILPGIQAAYEASNRLVALLRTLRVLNALTEYAEKNGHEASGLADLSLPADAMVDPYTGKPLVVTHTDAGWMVYALGANEKDDGGKVSDYKDVGVGANVKADAEAEEEATEK